jgi:HEAT repeat protein
MKNMGIFGPDIEKLMHEKNIDKLVKALKHVKSHTRAHAAYALGEINAHEAVEPLIQSLYDSHVDVRTEAARSLGILKDPTAEVHIFVPPLRRRSDA